MLSQSYKLELKAHLEILNMKFLVIVSVFSLLDFYSVSTLNRICALREFIFCIHLFKAFTPAEKAVIEAVSGDCIKQVGVNADAVKKLKQGDTSDNSKEIKVKTTHHTNQRYNNSSANKWVKHYIVPKIRRSPIATSKLSISWTMLATLMSRKPLKSGRKTLLINRN